MLVPANGAVICLWLWLRSSIRKMGGVYPRPNSAFTEPFKKLIELTGLKLIYL